MKNEIWKPINGYKGIYEVSNLGRIKSLKRTAKVRNNGIRTVPERIMTPVNTNGYMYLGLGQNGKTKRFYVHRLAAIAFIPNPQCKPQVNHIDGDKANNTTSNLEWCTYSENIRHAHATGLSSNSKKLIGKKRLKEHQARALVLDLINGLLPIKKLAAKYGVSQSTVYNIRAGRQWGDLYKNETRLANLKRILSNEQ